VARAALSSLRLTSITPKVCSAGGLWDCAASALRDVEDRLQPMVRTAGRIPNRSRSAKDHRHKYPATGGPRNPSACLGPLSAREAKSDDLSRGGLL